eukprot:5099555-Pyramimonas_sp.AAC.2
MLCGRVGDWRRALQVYLKAREQRGGGGELHVITYAAIITVLGRCKQSGQALQVCHVTVASLRVLRPAGVTLSSRGSLRGPRRCNVIVTLLPPRAPQV